MTAQTIRSTEALVAKLQALPPEQQRQVQDFVEFLAMRYGQALHPEEDLLQQRVLGLHQGQVWVSDDFDHPLPDEFWLGEPDPLSDEMTSGQV